MPRTNVSGEVRFGVLRFDVREDAAAQCGGVLGGARRFEELEGFVGERPKVRELGLREALPGEHEIFPGLRADVAHFVEGLPEHPVERSQVSFSETLLLGKPPPDDLLHRLAILFRREHRGVELALKHGAVISVDETETPQGAPVVRSDPVAAVLEVGVRD